MRNRAKLIEQLESYRQTYNSDEGFRPESSDRVLMAWIFHDNLLEGRTFKPEEIQAALRREDHLMPSYLRPLLEDIRSYESAISMIGRWAKKGPSQLNLTNLETLHKHLMKPEPKEGARLRKNSPVHRDYHHEICSHRDVPKKLDALFEEIQTFDVLKDDVLSFAARLHHQLMYIYPYRRQPGTLARLFTNQFLISNGYPPLILASHERGHYYDALATHNCAALAQLFYQAAWRYLDSIFSTSSKLRSSSSKYAM